ncbi:MAG TPA: carboxypeptidase-like regulatory domain-containing protein [Terracidiphilus sp.]|nr:carboxypeptidase-like regulatory domain-containing protein [Terracidiphilus sp.]
MAEGRWINPINWFACAMALVCAAAAVWAQVDAGSLAGRITDLYSHPLDGATVIVRNRATGAEARAVTGRNGAYRFDHLGAGEYSLVAEARALGRGELDGIVVVAGHEARVQAALAFAPAPAESSVAEPQPKPLAPAAFQPPAPLLIPLPVPGIGPVVEHASADSAIPSEALEGMRPAVRAIPAQRAELKLPEFPAEPMPETAHATAVPALMDAAAGPARLQVRGTAAPMTLQPVAVMKSASSMRGTALALVRVAALTVRSQALRAVLAASIGDGAPWQPVSAKFTGRQLEDLPLAEGAWTPAVLDTRTAAPDDSQEDRPSGGREAAALIAVDGVTTRLAFGGGRGRSAALIGPGAGTAVLREVQAATGNAEEMAGRSLGGHARATTERGGDRVHGQAFLFDRQTVWSAQNPFSQWTRKSADAAPGVVPTFTSDAYTPPDRAARFGASAGGRMGRSDVYWFASVEDSGRNDPGLSIVRHPESFFAQPSNDAMQVLAARLDLGSADPVDEGIAAYSTMLETLAGLLGQTPRTSARWTGFGRVDMTVRRGQLTLEGTGANTDAPNGGLTRVAEAFGTHSYGASHTNEQWLLARWEMPLALNLIVVTQGSFGRHNHTELPAAPSAFEQSLDANAWGRLPQIAVDTRYGFTIGNPARFGPGSDPDERLYRAQQQLAWTHGRLLLSVGAELGHTTDTTSYLRNETGSYSYSTVENFASDALAFAKFGLEGQLNPDNQHNCDETGRVWRDGDGVLHGLGSLPCYAHYTQTIGPDTWWLRTNDWAAFATMQRRMGRQITLSAALRWEMEQAPPPMALTANPDLPQAGQMPAFGGEWGPRAGLAWGSGRNRMPVLRLGYGMYFARTPNAALETALTHTGSPRGDLSYFLRSTDNLNGGGAPPFPYVLAGPPATAIKPEVVEFGAAFRNGEVHQAVASIEETMPGRVQVTAGAAVSLGRRLPLTLDANIDPNINPKTITYQVVDGNGSGPIRTPQITVPFYATWPNAAHGGRLYANYAQIAESFSGANATYESAFANLAHTARNGLTVRARYTYAHALDWNPDSLGLAAQPSVLDPADLHGEYGTSDLDVRHSATVALLWQPRWHADSRLGMLVNGWGLSGIGAFRSGLPYTMRTADSLAREFTSSGALIVGLERGINGYGGDNRVYGVGRNTFRYPNTWKADLRLAKRFNLGEVRELEVLVQSFNLFNHQNVTQLETIGYDMESGTRTGGLPTLTFLTGLKPGSREFGQPIDVNATDFLRPRQFEFGVRMRF